MSLAAKPGSGRQASEPLRPRVGPLVESVAESTTACLVTMVQGNLLALTMSHWVIASRTGLIAGLLAGTALLVSRTERRWRVSVVLGATTAVVDFFVHPGQFGPVAAEALVTGLGAALLSYAAGALLARRHARPETTA